MAVSVLHLHLDFSKEVHHVQVFKFPHIKELKCAQIRPGPKGARAQMDPRAKWAQGRNGPRPSWAWGLNGPRPISNWAQGLNGCKAHMGLGCGSTGNRGNITTSISTYNVILYALARWWRRSRRGPSLRRAEGGHLRRAIWGTIREAQSHLPSFDMFLWEHCCDISRASRVRAWQKLAWQWYYQIVQTHSF